MHLFILGGTDTLKREINDMEYAMGLLVIDILLVRPSVCLNACMPVNFCSIFMLICFLCLYVGYTSLMVMLKQT